MADSKREIRRKFEVMMEHVGYRASVAGTLNDFLLAAPSQHGASESAVLFVLDRLWVDDPKKGTANETKP